METELLSIGVWKDLEAGTEETGQNFIPSFYVCLSYKSNFVNYSAFQESDIYPKECKWELCLSHTCEGNLYHPLGQHSYGHSTVGWSFLPVVSRLNVRLIARKGERALKPGEIGKKTANVGNNMKLCWLYKDNYTRHLRES